MSIEIENIGKQFGSFTALKDVSLSIPSGELVALLGPSGGSLPDLRPPMSAEYSSTARIRPAVMCANARSVSSSSTMPFSDI